MRVLRQFPGGTCGDTLAIVLAGGNGTRLSLLTRRHAKPALPFGGDYRNIDFTLSNCINSGIRRIGLLTQYKAHSLIKHVHGGWGFLHNEAGEFIELWPAQQRVGKRWYGGTADAVYQNLDIIDSNRPKYDLILAGDHIYKMDFLPMLQAHERSGADLTIGCVEVPLETAHAYGVLAIDSNDRVTDFQEKPRHPRPIPERRDLALASMGIYVFTHTFLMDFLRWFAERSDACHDDFGHHLLPTLIQTADVRAYAFRDAETGRTAYWRDVGTVDCYWQANMDLLDESPAIDLNDSAWPIWTSRTQHAPARFVRGGTARDSIVAGACRVAGTVLRSVLCTGVELGSGSTVRNSLVLPGARIGSGCTIQRAIIDSDYEVANGTVIDGNSAVTRSRWFVSEGQVAVVTSAEEAARDTQAARDIVVQRSSAA